MLIDKATNRSVRVSYKPTLQKQIGESAFMRKRGLGVMPDEIPLEEQMELVNLVWDAPEKDILTIGEVATYKGEWFPELMGFKPCAGSVSSLPMHTSAWWATSTSASRARVTTVNDDYIFLTRRIGGRSRLNIKRVMLSLAPRKPLGLVESFLARTKMKLLHSLRNV